MRAFYSDTTVSTSLLLAKTKVTPICGSTTPRKELNGAQLLSKILITVANVLSIPLTDVYAWSDSAIVLCWLSTSPSKLKSYVCNRVMDTVSRIPSTHWRYVPTDCNPADIASRGSLPCNLYHLSFGGRVLFGCFNLHLHGRPAQIGGTKRIWYKRNLPFCSLLLL